MVATFFILSGFVLSYKSLQYVRAYGHAALLKNLASSVFRRGPKLFLPCIPPLIMAAICMHFGLTGKSQHPLDEAKMVGYDYETVFGDWNEVFWYWERLLNFTATGDAWEPTIPPLCK
jgi:peptidoglycan/LPS O-acetylase OafA/YrhL